MKKLIYCLICGLLFCCACSDSDTGLDNPMQANPQKISLSFRCENMSPTRTMTDEKRIDDINLYLFPVNGDPARHVYIAPVRSVVLELPKGDYTLYAIANMGQNIGPRSQDFVRTLHCQRNPCVLAESPFPMSAQQEVSVRGDTAINLSLVRAVAKVNLTYTVAAEFAKTFRVHSVQLRNAPRSVNLFGSSRAQSTQALTDIPPEATPEATHTKTYYLLENMQGQVKGIDYQQQKDQSRAPEYATYIAIAGDADGANVVYRIYLGENNTTDFNVQRNRVYNIDARILGKNTLDWRVTTTELSLAPFSQSYTPGQDATSTLQLVATNAEESTFFISYHIEKGAAATMRINGVERKPDTLHPLCSGSGTHTVDLAYKQDVSGEVRLRVVVTDNYDLRKEYVLSTEYKKPVLEVTFSQEGYELAARDMARVTYTVSQPGYTGKYTARFSSPDMSFYQYSVLPTNEVTLHEGNGTYELQIKPEAVGIIPFTVTITDEQGNSTHFESSVKGVLTTVDFTLDYRLFGGALDILMESSYPVSEDLKITVTATVEIVYSGGYTKTQDYTFDVDIEADRSRGRGYVYLDVQGRVSVNVLKQTMKSTTPYSLNGMVKYNLK